MADEIDYTGKLFGNYRVIAKLTNNLHSSIYIAHHVLLQKRSVAIKIVYASRLNTAEKQEKFLHEAQLLDLLKHPHILPLVDVGIEHDLSYLMTEYAPNGSLRDRLECQGPAPLPLEETLALLAQIGDALQYAHDQDIIHCDLKPQNILFHTQWEIWLADFGIATMMKQAEVKQSSGFGSLAYMAPEQIRGVVSKQSDQYALGCLAYELVTGQQPFMAFSFRGIMQKHLLEEPLAPTTINPQLPAHIEAAILKAMAKQSSERFVDIRAFIAALGASSVSPSSARLLSSSPTAIPAQSVETKTKEQWLDEALSLYNAKSFEDSLLAYEQALELDPQDAYVYVAKGLALCDLQRYAEALAIFEQAIELDAGDAYAYLAKGRVLRIDGRYLEALESYEYAIQLDPNDVDGHLGKGLTLEQMQRHHDALRAYEEAIIYDPLSITAWQYKANTLEQLGLVEEARAASVKVQQLHALADIQCQNMQM